MIQDRQSTRSKVNKDLCAPPHSGQSIRAAEKSLKKMSSTYSEDEVKKMTVVQLMSYLTDRKVTLPATRALKQTYVDLALEEIRKERAGIKPPPEPKAASRMQSPKKTPAKSAKSETPAEPPLADDSGPVEPTQAANGEEPPVVLLPLPTPPPSALQLLGKGLVFAIGIAIIAIAMAYLFRFVYDQPEPEPATYWDIAHSKILEILHVIEERYIKPAFKSLGLKSAS
ncbi:hypothetical protein KFL_002080080 [Klebsormidium nitens]|uniref:LEM domain-containing protein n=1 Tax=Klebsormidium nitens TaxID=105231 RepID=A0A1Y1I6R7_KLENI|nr:hypothetical protein KFL_002080080 [Klebsormidium nitens]|eukprot:GAQ84831.1 hypothetical protein KFL_002080080 [Klebsormidium nitens]